jgi:Leucine-rich repeat (LRR) protein
MEALFDLYAYTNGESWLWSTNTTLGIPWNFTDTNKNNPCTDRWQGITCTPCTSNAHYSSVSELSLVGYNLHGPLPDSISNLTSLTLLNLRNNILTGPIPSSIGQLIMLEDLVLGHNILTFIPDSVGNLTQLVTLDLSINKFNYHTLPVSFGRLVNLQYLLLNNNYMVGSLPAEWADMSSLVSLSLQNNKLNGTVPAEIGRLQSLTFLALSNNRFSGPLPDSLGNLTNLIDFYISYNKFKGHIWSWLGKLQNLEQVAINSNYLSGVIPGAAIGNLTVLQNLYAGSNVFCGTIPPQIGSLNQLQQLHLDYNSLTGTIPDSLGNLSNLLELGLSSNQLYGSIPPSIGNLAKLTDLFLSTNEFNGRVPESFSGLTSLVAIYLTENKFTGTLPAGLIAIPSTKTLELFDNQFSGPIPDCFSFGAQLENMYFYSNNFTGPLPVTLSRATSLESVDLSYNQFTGLVPSEWAHIEKLELLLMDSNFISGTIPRNFSQLHQLHQLSFNDNWLSGHFPDFLGRMNGLQEIAFNENSMTGPIPDNLCDIVGLRGLYANNNELVGTLPESLGECYNLLLIDFSYNELSGTMDMLFNHLFLLNSLYLTHNHFTGHLSSFVSMPVLAILFLDENRLNGPITSIFNETEHTRLATLVLNNNEFTGPIPEVIFRLPSLVTFVGATNCFSTRLPESLCDNRQLRSLILDGLASASACRNMLLPGISASYSIYSSDSGTIPNCVYSLPGLSTLHLSGNRYTGSLPSEDIEISQSLTDLSISHNALTGTIPNSLQSKAWVNLDLSFNHLKGTLSESIQGLVSSNKSYPGVIFAMENNRLSGKIPDSVRSLTNIAILTSNLFSCSISGSDLPKHDSDASDYQCGSTAFDVPYYVWLGLVVALAGVITCMLYGNRGISSPFDVNECVKLLRSWWNVSLAVDAHSNSLSEGSPVSAQSKYFNFVQWMLYFSGAYTLLVVLVLLPMYTICSQHYGTVKHSYTWLVSAAFLSGSVPFALEFSLWALLLLLPLALYHSGRYNTPAVVSINLYLRRRECFQVQRNDVLIAMGFTLLNIIFVGGANAAFIYTVLYQSSELQVFAQIMVASFKMVWNSIAMPLVLQYVIDFLGVNTSASSFGMLQTVVLLLNNIGIPYIVVMYSSPSCFYNVFVAAPLVNSQYLYAVCADPNTSGCLTYKPAFGQTSYDPPFSYNYQCSASLITYYSPALVVLCILNMFVVPVLQILAALLLKRATVGSKFYVYLNTLLPEILKPVSSLQEAPAPSHSNSDAQEQPKRKEWFQPQRVINSIVSKIGLLMTFGMMFPPLAVCLFCTICAVAVFSQLKMGRLLCNAELQERIEFFRNKFEAECQNVCSELVLYRTVWMLVTLSCWFSTLFLFDTLGDAVGYRGAYWVLIVVPLLPIVLFLVYSFMAQEVSKDGATHRGTASESFSKGEEDLERSPSTFEMTSVLFVDNPVHSQS